jgi:hypothetical protein
MTGNFADSGDFHAIIGIFYMLKICDMVTDGFTSPTKEGMLMSFSP